MLDEAQSNVGIAEKEWDKRWREREWARLQYGTSQKKEAQKRVNATDDAFYDASEELKSKQKTLDELQAEGWMVGVRCLLLPGDAFWDSLGKD